MVPWPPPRSQYPTCVFMGKWQEVFGFYWDYFFGEIIGGKSEEGKWRSKEGGFGKGKANPPPSCDEKCSVSPTVKAVDACCEAGYGDCGGVRFHWLGVRFGVKRTGRK